MVLRKPYDLYVDGSWVAKVEGLGEAHERVLRLGDRMAMGQRLGYEVKLGKAVVWEGEAEKSELSGQ
ncbi:hypothetical protein [Ralstonia pickettii]|jgi:hypothetical protein|uniref:hypothetical protein n=1 Tax=Ralstonia pickettii TaxID=329 RepID=UPI0015FABEF6|nr:hypothetical protein [Ralstonia pickettii]MBB0024436.1 hypothetical protein [Ralstonia pickettii]MBB0035235.1 hypothetical protein [Ralstonia pickettii]MBB0097764.1 hypothetical protein [Ralstonia pickettii]MBB0107383.1 hypothetical protein [Ralstonia pickettii]MBB0128538.1 hypothetical protein [Ralstonia pickettii]